MEHQVLGPHSSGRNGLDNLGFEDGLRGWAVSGGLIRFPCAPRGAETEASHLEVRAGHACGDCTAREHPGRHKDRDCRLVGRARTTRREPG